ncbi:tautomerase family protein [Streptomyces sp. NPDC090080]|uniref:tautomerase family protein n=1 Tax=Streptomyces sp. NPDC090080 TaxID=3365939 RepID=UPI00380A901C
MPLWHIYHPPGAYTSEQKQHFAADVTGFYTGIGLPAFYAVIVFHEVEAESFFIGGKPAAHAVRIVVEHIARHSNHDPALSRKTAEALAAIIAPHTKDRGLSFEFHVDETPRELWMTDGVWPPPARSEAERIWARENRPLPY